VAVRSAGLRPKSDCSGKAQKKLYSKFTDPSSRQRGRYKTTNPQLSKGNFKEKEKLVAGPDGLPAPRQTGRLTVGRILTSTSVRLAEKWDGHKMCARDENVQKAT
jgi:hypothetical protein